MPNVPAGLILPANVANNAIPAGFVREPALDGRHPKGAGAGADPGETGGAANHTHASPAHTHTIDSHSHTGSLPAVSGAAPAVNAGSGTAISSLIHTHTAATSGSATASLSAVAAVWNIGFNDPPRREVIWLRSLGTAPGIPDGGWAFWDAAELPSNWIAPPLTAGRFLRGAAPGADPGGTGGTATSHSHNAQPHTHPFAAHGHGSEASGQASAQDDAEPDPPGSLTTIAPTITHTHIVTFGPVNTAASGSATSANTGSTSELPPYIRIGLIENDSGGPDLPVGIVGAWLGLRSAIPLSLTECDGDNDTLDTRGRYLRVAETSDGDFVGIGDTGGALTHDHTDPSSHTHNANHQHNVASGINTGGQNYNFQLAQVGIGLHAHAGTSSSSGGTSDTGTQTVDTANHEPPYMTVIWVKYTGAIDVTITSPASETVLSSPAFSLTWTLSEGTQTHKRVRIYASDQTSVVYDSGVIASTVQSHDVPSSSGLRTGRTYYVQVSAINGDGVPGDSQLLEVSTSWIPPDAVTGLTATPIGGIE